MNLDYREPADSKELESLFHLRHTVYAEDSLLHKMLPAHSMHDITRFDLNALHFAGFDGKKPVAYMRMVTRAETKFSGWVKTILSAHKQEAGPVQTPFPFQAYCADKKWSTNFIDQLRGRKIGEVGKLAIDKEYRKGGLALNGLIYAFIYYCREQQKFDTGFGSCILPLERYYRKFGFKRAKGAVPFKYEGLPEAVIVKFDR